MHITHNLTTLPNKLSLFTKKVIQNQNTTRLKTCQSSLGDDGQLRRHCPLHQRSGQSLPLCSSSLSCRAEARSAARTEVPHRQTHTYYAGAPPRRAFLMRRATRRIGGLDYSSLSRPGERTIAESAARGIYSSHVSSLTLSLLSAFFPWQIQLPVARRYISSADFHANYSCRGGGGGW